MAGPPKALRARVSRFGEPDVLRLEEFTPRQPPRRTVRVRVTHASVGSTDAMARSGGDLLQPRPGFVPGYHFVGVLETVNAAATHREFDRACASRVAWHGWAARVQRETASFHHRRRDTRTCTAGARAHCRARKSHGCSTAQWACAGAYLTARVTGAAASAIAAAPAAASQPDCVAAGGFNPVPDTHIAFASIAARPLHRGHVWAVLYLQHPRVRDHVGAPWSPGCVLPPVGRWGGQPWT
jgi:NADPH:quinone reductase-like Zn-dependent oxidoreductase